MQFHPEGVDVSPHALGRLEFLAALRVHLNGPLAADDRRRLRARIGDDRAGLNAEALRAAIESHGFHQAWSSLLRGSQDLMWHYIGEDVDRDLARLQRRFDARRAGAAGSVSSDAGVEIPEYLRTADTHRMPGSFFRESSPDDLGAGALYDVGGAIYQLGIGNDSGQLLNDSRGRTVVSHLRYRYPDLVPSRVLDLGCGVGHNTIPLAQAYPDARVTGIDIGGPMVRYAHLRSEGLGIPVDFVQADAARTGLPDATFDLVVSQILLHETSPAAMRTIIGESLRLVRPGGVVVHLEVPIRFERLDDVGRVLARWEQDYNAESNLSEVLGADFEAILTGCGAVDVTVGYQPIPPAGTAAAAPLQSSPTPGKGYWYLVSARRPA